MDHFWKQTPLLLEIDTQHSKLRDIVEKIAKSQSGHEFATSSVGASCFCYWGTVVTVEDLQQEFSCNINIKHRVEFDEEKEPDGMILSGWTQALTTENNKNSPAGNGTSTSSQALPVETVVDDEFEILPGGTETLPLGKKGKIADSSNASSISFEEVTKRKAEELEPDSHIVVLEDSMDKDDGKKKRLQ
ncbi:putative SUMO-activating enzyme subunit 2 [Heracleum sosnowskyi]|uniref:SUMO-activating enzyme subunit 2 n=1 Tax=Heracleum sosnowskyi TaxID=360622 RepID=A0AAD8HNV3_9APIA|nr:putative SUMO-activating enzyme subunit 2 [Heracleum sosnowskyi]